MDADDEENDDFDDSDNKEDNLDDDLEISCPKKKIRKNPDVDTSFLPDREREEEENKMREELRQVCF